MEMKRIYDILDRYIATNANQKVALASKKEGKWHKISIQEYVGMTNIISYGLLALGIGKGDKVGIVSSNRPEWNMLDFAAMQIGAVSVPIYPTISQDDYRHILNHAEMKIIFIEGKDLRARLEPILPTIKTLKEIFVFEEQSSQYKTLSSLIELGRNHPQPEKLTVLKAEVKAEDLATIIYTSGTTGAQKGVMLSHSNLVNQIMNLYTIPASWSKTALSFLPLCHAYERMIVYLYQYLGMSVYYAENLGTIAENIKEVNPTMMTCVPRLLEKIYDKLYLSGKNLPIVKKSLYYWAFRLAEKYQLEEKNPLKTIQYKLADKLIYSKWRAAIGGNFDIVVSGGSAIPKHIASFFSAMGMPVFEGYGLTETSPVIAVSQRGRNGRKFGTVGLPLPGVSVKIVEQDEIICKGHNVMMGYYKDPELTAQVIDKDGWFHTGDTGKFTAEGQLVITGRLKSLFKTSFGKYVNPDAIEAKFSESPFIENMLVVGENKKFAAALIAPNFTYLRSWAKKHEINNTYMPDEEIIKHPEVMARFQQEVKKYNQFFGDYEQIKKFELVSESWTPESGFLSPTLKNKRKILMNFYAEKINKIFD